MEPIDLCGSSSTTATSTANSTGSSGTASRLAGGHVRRRTPRLIGQDPDKDKLWSAAPVLLDFSEPDEPPKREKRETPTTKPAAKKAKITKGKPLARDEGKDQVKEKPIVGDENPIQSSLESMNAHSIDTMCSPVAPVVTPGGWKPLKKKEPSAPSIGSSTGSVSSFFCKARPSDVIKLVQEVVSEQEKASKKSWRTKVAPIKEAPVKSVEQMVKEPEVVVVEEKPSWAKLLDDKATAEARRKSDIVSRGSMDPSMMPEALRKIQMNKMYSRSALPESVPSDIDPALQAALRLSASSKDADEGLVDLPFVVEVAAVLIEQDLSGELTHKPLAFKINNKTNFGNIKIMYCNSRKISSMGLLLTHRDVPLFDSVTVSASGIEPEGISSKIRLVLYDKVLFERMKAEQQKAKAATMEILKEKEVHEAIDVSAYMEDNDSDEEGQTNSPASDGLLTIKVIAGSKTFESFRIAPTSSLSDLLELFLAKYPETPKNNARFIFDGDVLVMTKSIQDAELEDGDQLELRT